MKPHPKLWFKAKNYGWGWVPVTWQGWAVVLVFVVFVVVLSPLPTRGTACSIAAYFSGLIGSIALLMAICLKKGEKPEWRWGRKKN